MKHILAFFIFLFFCICLQAKTVKEENIRGVWEAQIKGKQWSFFKFDFQGGQFTYTYEDDVIEIECNIINGIKTCAEVKAALVRGKYEIKKSVLYLTTANPSDKIWAHVWRFYKIDDKLCLVPDLDYQDIIKSNPNVLDTYYICKQN